MPKTLDTYKHLKVRITDSQKVRFRDWGKFENTPVAVDAFVISIDSEKTYTKFASAVCRGCGADQELDIHPYTHELSKPPKCKNENCSHYGLVMSIDEKTWSTGPYRIITLQEPMEEAMHGAPIIYTCEIKDDDVRTTFIGQRKKIVGAFTSYINPDGVNDPLIKAVSVTDASDELIAKASEEDIKEFKEWTKDKTFLQLKLSRSIAPEIYNEALAKMTCAISAAGGIKVDTLRGDVHAFLVGNPAVGKSKMLRFVYKNEQEISLC